MTTSELVRYADDPRMQEYRDEFGVEYRLPNNWTVHLSGERWWAIKEDSEEAGSGWSTADEAIAHALGESGVAS